MISAHSRPAIGFANQGHLRNVLHSLFCNNNIQENVRKSANIRSPTNWYLELDFWIPELKLAFEFQDPYHYSTIWYANKSVHSVQESDKKKREQLKGIGETLVTVPCWWDGSPESLVATIRTQRGDLFSGAPNTPPIPSEPPVGLFKADNIPDFGELMLPSFQPTNVFDPVKWWMGEKYDGFRVCWNPISSQLCTKNGTECPLFVRIVQTFPRDHFIEGEIWLGRATFYETQDFFTSAVHVPSCARIVAFDCLFAESRDAVVKKEGDEKFETRYASLLDQVLPDHPILVPLAQIKCKGTKHLSEYTQKIMEHAGEGTVIRKFYSPYQRGRSDLLIKYKAGTSDLEALVLDVDGSQLLLKLPNGVTFYAPLPSLFEPQAGDVVTVEYVHAKNGKPLEAQVTKVHSVLMWDDVVSSFHTQPPLNRPVALFTPTEKKRIGYWTDNNCENIRNLFSSVAQKHGRNPLVADDWYTLTKDFILAEEGGASALWHYGGNFVNAVMELYPEIGLDSQKLRTSTRSYWGNKNNRKLFLDALLGSAGITNLRADNWQLFSTHIFENSALAQYYGGSLLGAIQDLYPSADFLDYGFRISSRHWRKPDNRKQFFDSLAVKLGFDPSQKEKWYTVAKKIVTDAKCADSVLHFYGGSWKRALAEVYALDEDKIGLEANKTTTFVDASCRTDLHNKENRKYWFDQLAQSKEIDPSVLRKEHLQGHKECSSILRSYYGNSVSLALSDLYNSTYLEVRV